MTEIVPATPELLARFYGDAPKRTARAVAVVRGEEVLGVGGVYREGTNSVLFSDMTDELRKNKRALVKALRAVMRLMKGTVYSWADPDIEGSDVLLKHMGFEPYRDGVYQWQR
jgi:hypothetical protein